MKYEKRGNMINNFSGNYRFLSNFYEHEICVDEIPYPTMEHYFQAQKTNNLEEFSKIINARSPGKAKRIGRTVVLKDDWENIKISLMERGLQEKFKDNILKIQLLHTGENELVEGNNWNDTFWGVYKGPEGMS